MTSVEQQKKVKAGQCCVEQVSSDPSASLWGVIMVWADCDETSLATAMASYSTINNIASIRDGGAVMICSSGLA